MAEPNYTQAITYALDKLRDGLPPYLHFHNVWHTEGDVMIAAVRLAELSNIERDEIELLRVAAAYHDVGYVTTLDTHELAGSRVAAQNLPRFGFTSRQIERIMGMILATRVPQSPRNQLEEILADADLDLLGRDDFVERNAELFQEMAACGYGVTVRDWYKEQLSFLRNHAYFTEAARTLRESTKQKNIAILEECLRTDRFPVAATQ